MCPIYLAPPLAAGVHHVPNLGSCGLVEGWLINTSISVMLSFGIYGGLFFTPILMFSATPHTASPNLTALE